jgi:hypothetical protein
MKLSNGRKSSMQRNAIITLPGRPDLAVLNSNRENMLVSNRFNSSTASDKYTVESGMNKVQKSRDKLITGRLMNIEE